MRPLWIVSSKAGVVNGVRACKGCWLEGCWQSSLLNVTFILHFGVVQQTVAPVCVMGGQCWRSESLREPAHNWRPDRSRQPGLRR
jgi:hypothetical protein